MAVEYRIIGRVVSHDTKSGRQDTSEGDDKVLATFVTIGGANIFMEVLSHLQQRADKRPFGERD